jgi:hypothetical protein
LVNGEAVPLTPEEIAEFEASVAEAATFAWNSVRVERNGLLAASDWTQLSDAPVNKENWVSYRQALRDITNQEDPFNIVWPQEPE